MSDGANKPIKPPKTYLLILILAIAPAALLLGLFTPGTHGVFQKFSNSTGMLILWICCLLSLVCCFFSSFMLFRRRTAEAILVGVVFIILNVFIVFFFGFLALIKNV